jgi:glucose-1-phosphate thymidylyltransferase
MNNRLSDTFEKTLNPLCAVKPCFALENGIFSDLDRLLFQNLSQIEITINTDEKLRPPDFYKNYLHSINVSIKTSVTSEQIAPPVTPGALLSNFSEKLLSDLSFLKRADYQNNGAFLIDGEKSDAWVHNEAVVSPLAAINTQNGTVVIDRKARVSAFCILNGPLYVGPETILDRVMMSNSRAGKQCRLGGEISDSLIGNYTNKHHEGFLGHSLVGDWVNLGALTTTSDLKNNYGEINLQYDDETFKTGRIKFGGIIGDFAKTGIGTMLNTGTILDVGALLYQGFTVQKYYPRFFWGGEKPVKYQLDRFLADLEKIMARRSCRPHDFLKNQISSIYNQ